MENSVKEGKKGKVVVKKLFHKHGNPEMSGYFNARSWQNMTDTEREMWHPVDDTILEDPGKFDRHQSMKDMDQKAGDNLRLKAGQVIDLLGIDAEVLKWGPKMHLVELDYSRKHAGKPKRYGIVQRTTKDTSYGLADTITTFQSFFAYDTKEEAQSAYENANK